MNMPDFSIMRDILNAITLEQILLAIEWVLGACLLGLLLLILVYGKASSSDTAEDLNQYLQDWRDIGIEV